MKKSLVLFIFLLFLLPLHLSADIQFDALSQLKINIENLEIKKPLFISFVEHTVKNKPKGLGTYGKLNFNFCNIPVKGRPLSEYQTSKGRDVRFLSNPSCSQMVLSKLLTQNYKYNLSDRSSYDNRRCIRLIENITVPLFEYYTLKMELKPEGNCRFCDVKERERLQKIVALRNKIKQTCQSQSVLDFITELDHTIETSFSKR